MSDAVIAAAVGSTAPTLAAVLAYLNARAVRRQAAQKGLAGLTTTVDAVCGTVRRIEASIRRVESTTAELRERVARIEGKLDPASASHGR